MRSDWKNFAVLARGGPGGRRKKKLLFKRGGRGSGEAEKKGGPICRKKAMAASWFPRNTGCGGPCDQRKESTHRPSAQNNAKEGARNESARRILRSSESTAKCIRPPPPPKKKTSPTREEKRERASQRGREGTIRQSPGGERIGLLLRTSGRVRKRGVFESSTTGVNYRKRQEREIIKRTRLQDLGGREENRLDRRINGREEKGKKRDLTKNGREKSEEVEASRKRA